jgi:heme exporter protein D
MIWNSFGDFLSMGGYGLYVWGSMGMSALVLLIEVWQARQGRERALRQVRHELQARSAGKDWHS